MIEKVTEILKELLEQYVAENREEFLAEVSGENHYSVWYSENNHEVVSATMVSDNWSDQTRDICLFRKRSGYLDWDFDNKLSFRENLEEMLDEADFNDFLFEHLAERDIEEYAEEFGEGLLQQIFILYTTDKDDLIAIINDKIIDAWEEAAIIWNVLKEDKHDEELTHQLFGNYNYLNYQDRESLRNVAMMNQIELEKKCIYAKITQDIEDNEEKINRLTNKLTPAEAQIIVLRELDHSFISLAEHLKVNTQTLRDRHSSAMKKLNLNLDGTLYFNLEKDQEYEEAELNFNSVYDRYKYKIVFEAEDEDLIDNSDANIKKHLKCLDIWENVKNYKFSGEY